MTGPATLSGIEDIIDGSGAAPRIEALLPAGVRHRQLTARTLLTGMMLTLADDRPTPAPSSPTGTSTARPPQGRCRSSARCLPAQARPAQRRCPTDSFDRVLAVHLMGTIQNTRAAWPHMAGRQYGKIINTVSAVGYVGSPGRLEYGTAKAAVHGFTRGLSVESLAAGIYVNAISPGARTRPVTASTPDEFPEEIARAFGPELVSPTVVWLAHPDTRVNGEVFTAIAGTTAQVVIGEAYGWGSDLPTPEQIRDNTDRVFLSDEVIRAGLVRHFDSDTQGQTVIARFGNRT